MIRTSTWRSERIVASVQGSVMARRPSGWSRRSAGVGIFSPSSCWAPRSWGANSFQIGMPTSISLLSRRLASLPRTHRLTSLCMANIIPAMDSRLCSLCMCVQHVCMLHGLMGSSSSKSARASRCRRAAAPAPSAPLPGYYYHCRSYYSPWILRFPPHPHPQHPLRLHSLRRLVRAAPHRADSSTG